MPVTRSELMFLALGVAVGSVVGRNWDKVKTMLEPLLGPAAAGFGSAYGDLLGKFGEQNPAFKDVHTEKATANAPPNAPVPGPAATGTAEKSLRRRSRPLKPRRPRQRKSLLDTLAN